MIPKVIHYCWFGGKKLPASAVRCIRSWKKYCPDYQIKEWNESNFDVNRSPYIREALRQKKYAFATDLIRLILLYEEGGVYMDTDVELIAPLDDLMEGQGYMGFEAEKNEGQYGVNTGIGFASAAKHPLIEAMMRDYEGVHFVNPDGSLNTVPCPERNTKVLISRGLRPDNTEQVIEGIRILPSDYLCPIVFRTNEMKLTENTHSIHHYSMSWMSSREKWFFRYQHLIFAMKRNPVGSALIRLKKKIFPKPIGKLS